MLKLIKWLRRFIRLELMPRKIPPGVDRDCWLQAIRERKAKGWRYNLRYRLLAIRFSHFTPRLPKEAHRHCKACGTYCTREADCPFP